MMKNYSEERNQKDEWNDGYYVPGGWVAFIVEAVTAGITNVVTLALIVVVSILVVLGGLWLAYVYLPASVFTLILAVLLADIALGIVVRAVAKRR